MPPRRDPATPPHHPRSAMRMVQVHESLSNLARTSGTRAVDVILITRDDEEYERLVSIMRIAANLSAFFGRQVSRRALIVDIDGNITIPNCRSDLTEAMADMEE